MTRSGSEAVVKVGAWVSVGVEDDCFEPGSREHPEIPNWSIGNNKNNILKAIRNFLAAIAIYSILLPVSRMEDLNSCPIHPQQKAV